MAATRIVKFKCRQLLGITADADVAALEAALDEMDQEELDFVKRILDAADPIMTLQVKLDSDGVQVDQYKQLAGLRSQLAVATKSPNLFGASIAIVDPDPDDTEPTIEGA